ncbi:MAG TPA: hypothetical protein VGH74_07555 [Planctomycetaceae bacterium]|jgi:hypothetical protein
MKTFTDKAVARIQRAVQKSESDRPQAPQSWGQRILQALPIRLGKTTTSHTKGSTHDVNVYWGTTKGSETWDSVETISVYNRFANVASGKWVFCIWLLGGWEVFVAEC